VKFVEELPKTPSQKVSKQTLRDQAKAAYREMWDREASGIEVNRFTASKLAATPTSRTS
jgi:hypothetical protein